MLLTINVPLILKFRDIFFFAGKTCNAAFYLAQDNLGVKKVSAPSKNPKKCPIICFAPEQKNNFQDFQNQRYIDIFMSQWEKERERESKSKSESENKSESESGKGKEKGTGKVTGKEKGKEKGTGKGTGKGQEREKERERVQTRWRFISKLPGPE
jgi:flagellar biosynthesis/type III secretory pathway protein FliH